MSTPDVLVTAERLLATHADLVARVRDVQRSNRRQLRVLPSPPQDLLSLPLIPSPSASPSPSPPPSPPLAPRPKPPPRPDLPPAKRARLARYPNYVPEEETIRNDYSQRYVDSGEWPQNWVVGAELERRFEECVSLADTSTHASHPLPFLSVRARARTDTQNNSDCSISRKSRSTRMPPRRVICH